MSKTAIVTDTISCLPPDQARELGISIMPTGLVIDGRVYPDSGISNKEFWELFYKAKDPVTTNAVTPGDFSVLFKKLAQKADSIICILVSQALSATYKSAVMAKNMVKEENPDLNIEIIDSKSAAGAEGFIVLEAARAAAAGKEPAKIVQIIQDTIPRVNFFCALETMKYLIRSGRAPKIAVLGEWLKVKPIVSIDKKTGLVENVEKGRGMENAIEKMVALLEKEVENQPPVSLMVHYTDGIAAGEKLRDIITARVPCSEVYLTPYTPVMASQCGPVLAFSYHLKK
jgi:DegV family protein with EDD domain